MPAKLEVFAGIHILYIYDLGEIPDHIFLEEVAEAKEHLPS